MVIEKNKVNNCVFTLSEKTTIVNVNYLFELTNLTTFNSKTFIGADVSSNKVRYNEFLIEESLTENLLLSKVSLELGSYSYRIFEQLSNNNLDINLAGNEIENGFIKVIESDNAISTFTSTNNIVVFNG